MLGCQPFQPGHGIILLFSRSAQTTCINCVKSSFGFRFDGRFPSLFCQKLGKFFDGRNSLFYQFFRQEIRQVFSRRNCFFYRLFCQEFGKVFGRCSSFFYRSFRGNCRLSGTHFFGFLHPLRFNFLASLRIRDQFFRLGTVSGGQSLQPGHSIILFFRRSTQTASVDFVKRNRRLAGWLYTFFFRHFGEVNRSRNFSFRLDGCKRRLFRGAG